MIAPSRGITPAEQLEMMKKMDESNAGESFDDCEPSKQDLKVVLTLDSSEPLSACLSAVWSMEHRAPSKANYYLMIFLKFCMVN